MPLLTVQLRVSVFVFLVYSEAVSEYCKRNEKELISNCFRDDPEKTRNRRKTSTANRDRDSQRKNIRRSPGGEHDLDKFRTDIGFHPDTILFGLFACRVKLIKQYAATESRKHDGEKTQ